MKYIRLIIIKIQSHRKVTTILGFLLLLPLLSVLMGSFISKLLLPKSNINYTSSSKAAVQTTTTLDPVYYLQAGAFINKDNALALKNSLSTINTKGVIIEADGICKVIIDVSMDKDKLNTKKEELSEKGIYCLINQFDLSEVIKGKADSLAIYKTALDIIQIQITLKDKAKSITLKEMENYTKIIEEFNSESAIFLLKNNKDDMQKLTDNFKKLVNTFNVNLNENNQEFCIQAIINELILILSS